jgi:nucleoside 2-deoxyribosyltransferase
MKIYLAARYSRRDQMRELAAELRRMGHTVTSRWLETEWANRPDQSSAAPPEYRAKYACIDLDDVCAAEMVVNFTEAPGDGSRGGRHVEYGYALALGKRIVVIGFRENLFHEHPAVQFHASQWDWLRTLPNVAAEAGSA